MKKKILFLAFAALALVACQDRDPIDLNNVPEGHAHDLGATDDHEIFYKKLSETAEESISDLHITYMSDLSVIIDAIRQQEMVQIKMHVGKFE